MQSVPTSPAHSTSEKKHGSTSNPISQFNSSKLAKPASAHQYGFAPSHDPYARPLSAKNLLTVGIDRPKSSVMTNQPTNITKDNPMHATNLSNNDIFKPNDSHPQPKSKITAIHKRNLPSSLNTTKVISIQSPSSAVTQTAKEKFEASLNRPSTSKTGVRPPSALRAPSSLQIRNPNYSPTKPYQEVAREKSEEFQMVSDKNTRTEPDTLNGRVAKAITTLNQSVMTQNISKVDSTADHAETADEKEMDDTTEESTSTVTAEVTRPGSSSASLVGSAGSIRSSTSSNYYL